MAWTEPTPSTPNSKRVAGQHLYKQWIGLPGRVGLWCHAGGLDEQLRREWRRQAALPAQFSRRFRANWNLPSNGWFGLRSCYRRREEERKSARYGRLNFSGGANSRLCRKFPLIYTHLPVWLRTLCHRWRSIQSCRRDILSSRHWQQRCHRPRCR